MGDTHPLLQFIGAKHRVGLEGFFCVFKSSPELAFKPVFWWTCPELEDFMALTVRNTRWNSILMGARFEAFAVAGCDITGTFRFF
jgi:hypothetical protein